VGAIISEQMSVIGVTSLTLANHLAILVNSVAWVMEIHLSVVSLMVVFTVLQKAHVETKRMDVLSVVTRMGPRYYAEVTVDVITVMYQTHAKLPTHYALAVLTQTIT
jgi:hypothetical protein